MDVKVVATNRKAGHEFFLLEHFEAGLVLQGTEIKSIRAGQISLAEAYVRVDGRDAWLMDAHVAPYEQAGQFNHDPRRPRKLLFTEAKFASYGKTSARKVSPSFPSGFTSKKAGQKSKLPSPRAKNFTINARPLPNATPEREIERNLHR